VPENGILRDPVKHTVLPSPFIQGIVPLIILFFFVVSLAYGIATGKIRRQADLPQLMIEPMKEMAGFIVMVFPLAQFVAMFNWSNMGKFMAVGLTDAAGSGGIKRRTGVCRPGAAVVAAVYVYRQRLGNLVDSGADLCADVYDAGVPSGVCTDSVSHRRLLGDPAGAGFAVCPAVFRFPASAINRKQNWVPTIRWSCPIRLSF
jgi:hypothetical protein